MTQNVRNRSRLHGIKLALLAAVAVALAACGGGTQNRATPGTGDDGSSTTPMETSGSY